jgi:uncharacterized metal-binding protein
MKKKKLLLAIAGTVISIFSFGLEAAHAAHLVGNPGSGDHDHEDLRRKHRLTGTSVSQR